MNLAHFTWKFTLIVYIFGRVYMYVCVFEYIGFVRENMAGSSSLSVLFLRETEREGEREKVRERKQCVRVLSLYGQGATYFLLNENWNFMKSRAWPFFFFFVLNWKVTESHGWRGKNKDAGRFQEVELTTISVQLMTISGESAALLAPYRWTSRMSEQLASGLGPAAPLFTHWTPIWSDTWWKWCAFERWPLCRLLTHGERRWDEMRHRASDGHQG